jgi:hypothetical protein
MPRPHKLTPTLRRQILGLLRSGVGLGRSARMAGIHPDTAGRWIAERPDFAEAVEAARAESTGFLERQIAQASRRDWKAAAWILERRFPEEFGRPAIRMEAKATLDLEAVLAAIEGRRCSASMAEPALVTIAEPGAANPPPTPPASEPTGAPRPASVALTLEAVIPDDDDGED